MYSLSRNTLLFSIFITHTSFFSHSQLSTKYKIIKTKNNFKNILIPFSHSHNTQEKGKKKKQRQKRRDKKGKTSFVSQFIYTFLAPILITTPSICVSPPPHLR